MAENTSFTDTLKGLGPARLGVMGVVMAMLVIFFIFISLRVSEPNLSILYRDLNNVDSSAVAGKLSEEGINYQISPDGAMVYVSEEDVGRARMLLAQAGLPNGGSMGYEIFDDQSGFGTTTFVQNLNNKRALEGELARTIMSLDKVDLAKVHIVLPQRELFARESREATASVTLKVLPSERLSKQQIYGIQNLVANAVPELSAKKVTILDSEANLLAGGEDEGGPGGTAEEMRQNMEARMARAVEGLVGRVVGLDNVRATVTADLDFDRISTNSEVYDPEGQVLRSSQIIEEADTERTPPSDGVTVNNNLPGLDAISGEGNGPTSESSRIEELNNYEISRTVQSTVRESGEVNKLSVAVIVDGTYITDAEGNKTYQPRSEEDMEKIETLVRSAVGFDATRGDLIEIVNLPFAEVEFPEEDIGDTVLGFSKDSVLETVQMLTLGIMLLLVVLLVVKPILSQLFQSMQKEDEEEAEIDPLLEAQQRAALAAPMGDEEVSIAAARGADGGEDEAELMIDMQSVEGKVKASTVKKVGEIVSNHPSETVSVIRQWMTTE